MNHVVPALGIIFQQSFYRNIALVTFLVVAYLSYWLINQTTTIPIFLEMMQTGEFGKFSLLYGITYIIATFLITVLSGISIAVMVWLYSHSKLGKGKTVGANAGGLIAAAFGMGCPVCGTFLLSATGIAGGLTIFPLQGLELKFLSIALLMGSTLYALSKVKTAVHCTDCADITHGSLEVKKSTGKRLIVLPLEKFALASLIVAFSVNQFLITQTAAQMGLATGKLAQLLGIQSTNAKKIIAPKMNPDGRTTSLVEQPTITEVLANPRTGDALADARVVMIATGKPFYAPDDISFDDPINAQKKWGAYEKSISLSADLEQRYQWFISNMVCSYCCGGPTSVTTINRCGCAHAKAARGFFKFMLQNYSDTYSNDQLLGEGHRWYAIWYPKGMLEDYLLATGNEQALTHQTHGGAGTDGRHGL